MIFAPSARYSDGKTSKSTHAATSSTTASSYESSDYMMRRRGSSGASGSGVGSSATSGGHLYQDYYSQSYGYSGHGYYDDDDFIPVST